MRNDGVPLKDVAARAGRSYYSIMELCRARGILKPMSVWKRDPTLESRLIAMRNAGEKQIVIAAELDLTVGQVAGRLARLTKKGKL